MSMLAVATNIAGLNTHRNLKVVSGRSEKASEKLSTGYKINRAGDDAAGLAISEKMRNQIKGLNMAQKDVEDGISLIKTAEGGMQEISEMIKRERELVIQAMNDTNTPEDRAKIQEEINQLTAEVDGTAKKTKFNGLPLLNVFSDVEHTDGVNGVQTPNGVQNISIPANGMYRAYLELDQSSLNDPAIFNALLSASAGYEISSDIGIRLIAPTGEEFFTNSLDKGSKTSQTFPAAVGDVTIARHSPETGQYVWFKLDSPTQNAVGTWTLELDNRNNPNEVRSGTLRSGNGRKLDYEIYNVTDDGPASPLYIQAGANEEQGLLIDRYDCRARALGIDPIIVDPIAKAEKSLGKLDRGLEKILEYRATAGAQQNRLEHTSRNLGTASENLSAAESRIRDTDMAKEMMEFTKSNILSQAGMSMLAQANQQPNQVLSILK